MYENKVVVTWLAGAMHPVMTVTCARCDNVLCRLSVLDRDGLQRIISNVQAHQCSTN